MTPAPPPSFWRRVRLRQGMKLAPALAVAALAFSGHIWAAAAVFAGVFSIMAYVTLSPATRLLGPVMSRLPDRDGVLITIDDGPWPETTPALLDVLDDHGVRAVFFLIGERVQRWPDLARLVAHRGHAIGNHTQHHRVATFWSLGPAATWREIAAGQATLEEVAGVRPSWFRAPVGHFNLFTHPALADLHLRLMGWSASGYDGVDSNTERVVARIARRLEPGAIVLLHDARSGSAEVLGRVLETIRARGLATAEPPAAGPPRGDC